MITNLLNNVLHIWIGKNLLNFSLKQLKFNSFVTNQLNISKFLSLLIRKHYVQQFSRFILLVFGPTVGYEPA